MALGSRALRQMKSRYRLGLVLTGVVAWVALLSALHFRGGGSARGAGELLEIGALPVT